MKPSHAQLAEDILKVEVLGSCLRDRGVGTVRAADRASDAETTLGEIQAVAADAADTVRLLPIDERRINSALADEVLEKSADFVLRERGDDGGLEAKALTETADDIVLSAALPGSEGTCRADTAFAGIKPQHDFS